MKIIGEVRAEQLKADTESKAVKENVNEIQIQLPQPQPQLLSQNENGKEEDSLEIWDQLYDKLSYFQIY